jgi:hypothetical protein
MSEKGKVVVKDASVNGYATRAAMDDPPFVKTFPNASRAVTLNICMSPAVHTVVIVLNDASDVVAHIGEGTTVSWNGIPIIGVMLNKDVELIIDSA